MNMTDPAWGLRRWQPSLLIVQRSGLAVCPFPVPLLAGGDGRARSCAFASRLW
jgi:hypothetical protein